MKMLRLAAVAFALLVASPAVAQWQTPNHSVPIGRGVGKTGFGSAVPGVAGQPLVSTGLTLDPAFGQAANNGIAPGAANTVKGSLDGANTSDIAVPSCTGLGQAIRWAAGVGPNCGTVVATTGFDMPINLGLSASVASTSLTLTVTQASGSAPTAGNPVVVPFRSTTATSGAVSTGSITGTVSLTIPSGASLGTLNGTPFRIWIFLTANGGGTPALAVSTCSSATVLFPCVAWENSLKTTTTISAGATSNGTPYAAVGVASDAVRIVGYCDYASGLATAGSWISACTTLQVMGPGSKKPGDVVQTIHQNVSTATTGTTVIPYDSTIPQITEGDQYLSQAVTPTTTPNLLQVQYQTVLSVSTGTQIIAALFQDATANALSAVVTTNASSTSPHVLTGFYQALALTTSSTTFRVRAGINTAGTMTFNGTAGNPELGVMNSFIRVTEIMG